MGDLKQTYLECIQRGELSLQYCGICQRYFFYPRSHCPLCWGQDWEWRQARGKGRVYSYSIVLMGSGGKLAGNTPYIYALVTLDEGVRMTTRIVDCDPAQVYIDMPVEMGRAEIGAKTCLVFRPVQLDFMGGA